MKFYNKIINYIFFNKKYTILVYGIQIWMLTFS